MKLTSLRANSNNSWLEATKLLISAALENGNNPRRLSIQEDEAESTGKYRLLAHVRSR